MVGEMARELARETALDMVRGKPASWKRPLRGPRRRPRVGRAAAKRSGLVICVAASLLAGACADPAVKAEEAQRQVALEAERQLELEARRTQLRNQFASVQNQLRRVQAEAMNSPGVQLVQDSFYATLRRRMIQLDPRAEEWLDRATRAGHDLARAGGVIVPGDESGPVTLEEKQRVATEVGTLEKLMLPVQQRAMQDPVVMGRFQVLQDSLIQNILRIDPAAQILLDQTAALESEIRQLDSLPAGD